MHPGRHHPFLARRVLWSLLLVWGLGALGCLQQDNQAQSLTPPEGMVLIPEGEFWMGSNRQDTEGLSREYGSVKPFFLDEHPLHKLHLQPYFIDRFEVTNAQYAQFVRARGYPPPPNWPGGEVPPGKEDHPVTMVSWYDADHYCRWLGKRLPTEAEWEKAARGTDGREYPWGNTFDPKKANTGPTQIRGTTPVGSFEAGKSPYGVYDMAGNVWEWVQDWYQAYPGADYQDPRYGNRYKVIRGGGWGGIGHYSLPIYYRTAYRFFADPTRAFNDVGFRCAKDAR